MSIISEFIVRSITLPRGRVVRDKSVTVRPRVLKPMALYNAKAMQLNCVSWGPFLSGKEKTLILGMSKECWQLVHF